MEILRVITGYLEENCYVLVQDNKCLVVDPGSDFLKIKEVIKNYELVGILITHHHFDHVGALKELLEFSNVNIFDYRTLEDVCSVGPFSFSIISNPGHSKDSVSFYFENEKIMFVGDFIFKGTIGRCDLEGGNFDEMKDSLTRIKQYADDIILYPGHGDFTTLKEEKKYNIYFTE
ncbi:MAG: MBL fold metallo-hydrolase [Firmicutes bacterium]|nr:MBL fold metallo-hydrolase [Bacillota bacterium]